jgi:hypothetical protein
MSSLAHAFETKLGQYFVAKTLWNCRQTFKFNFHILICFYNKLKSKTIWLHGMPGFQITGAFPGHQMVSHN